MDASHVGWFRSLFDQFAAAIARDDFVEQETPKPSVRCVELISAAYASARDRSPRARARRREPWRVIDLAARLGLALVDAGRGGRLRRARVARAAPRRIARIERAGRLAARSGKSAMEMGYWAMRPVARGLMARRADGQRRLVGCPSRSRRLAGVALAAGASASAPRSSLVSSACDALDGMIARETRTASDAGEVLDAAIDRYAELFFFGGVAFHERFDAPRCSSSRWPRPPAPSW